MVISVEKAEQIAQAELERQAQKSGLELGFLPEYSIVRPLVCAFFFQSQEYIRTREFSSQLVGQGPILINRVTGEVVLTGSAYPAEHYIQELEKKLSKASSQ